MSDSQTQSDPNTTAPAQASDQKNPLDALEQILKEAKQKADQGKGGVGNTSDSTEPPEQNQADEEARKLAVIQQKADEQGVVDQQAIEQQLVELQQVVTTPEYQARVSQDEQKKVTDDEKRLRADQNAIIQLGHTKV
jgi:hypothetical protein